MDGQSSIAKLILLKFFICENNFRVLVHIVPLQTLYDEAFISLYNVCYTSLPILALAIFDQVTKVSKIAIKATSWSPIV